MLKYSQIPNTPIGNIVIISEREKIIEIVLKNSLEKETPTQKFQKNPQITKQIQEYLSGKRKQFKLKYSPEGTEFEKAVWHEITKIPYGEIRTYKQVASAIGKPKALRAVGNALSKNPIPLIIPCHRVVASQGWGGYSSGINIKKKLLTLESGQQSLL